MNKETTICKGCVREDNHPIYLEHISNPFTTTKELVNHAQKCPVGECIYDTEKGKLGEIKEDLMSLLNKLGERIDVINNQKGDNT